MDLWTEKKALKPNKYYRAQVGPLIFWLTRKNDEIQQGPEKTGGIGFDHLIRVDDEARADHEIQYIRKYFNVNHFLSSSIG